MTHNAEIAYTRRAGDEHLRSAAWKEAKAAALAGWQRGSADTTQMLMAARRAVDAALAVAVERAGTFCSRRPLCLGEPELDEPWGPNGQCSRCGHDDLPVRGTVNPLCWQCADDTGARV